eukprot:TRINITY_DN63182_c0_g1_i1.p1 TRINITY_DN63182_c0_g1~~TRINITY_DN63182_c0_g1_i1.p1  ORF type:complete len:304 (-),score=202.32 TRINITY_DN63182_c0_g1_i1:25-861(-)
MREREIEQVKERTAQQRQRQQQQNDMREFERRLERKELRRRIKEERLIQAKVEQERVNEVQAKVAAVRLRRMQEKRRQMRIRAEQQNTSVFLRQQNMITRQMKLGAREQLRADRLNATTSRVMQRKKNWGRRREAVQSLLMENFNRRRHAVQAQQAEMQRLKTVRDIREQQRIQMARARRQKHPPVAAALREAGRVYHQRQELQKKKRKKEQQEEEHEHEHEQKRQLDELDKFVMPKINIKALADDEDDGLVDNIKMLQKLAHSVRDEFEEFLTNHNQ